MSAIVLDASKVNSYVLPSLNKSENVMQTAYSTSVSLKNILPSSFSYKNTVNDIVNQIYNLKKEISNIDRIIVSKLESAKRIESKSESRVSSIASAASKIGSVVGAVKGAAIGATTGGVVGAVVGGVVGYNVGSTVGKGIVDTGAKIVGVFTSVCKKIGTGIKAIWDTGAKIVKSVASFVSNVIKGLGNVVSKIIGATAKIPQFFINTKATFIKGTVSAVESIFGINLSWLKTGTDKVSGFVNGIIDKAGNLVVGLAKGIGSYLGDLVTNPILTIKKTKATIRNICVSLLEGVFSFVEAIGDVALVAIGVVCSFRALELDIVNGLVTGNWNWSKISAIWKKWIVPWVGYDCTSKLFDAAYEYNFMGWNKNEKLAYGFAKRDGGVVYEIGKAVGYYTGIIVASAFTAGAAAGATAATSTAIQTSTAVMTGVGSMGKNSQKQFNKAIKTAETENREISGGEIWGALGVSLGKAVIDGGTLYLSGGIASKATKALEATKFGSKVINVIGEKGISIAIKASKGYTSEGFNFLVTGEKFDLYGATIDSVGTVLAETAALKFTKSGLYKNFTSFKGKPQESLQIKETIKVGEAASSDIASELVAGTDDAVVDSAKDQIKYVVGKLITNSSKYAINKAEEKTVKEVVGFVTDGLDPLAA